ncbi:MULTISPECIES: DUF3995 domain-containing protein [Streptosporangium]|uniref:DUF3995 domain-containing protein n=1 Tax=Streptosporangium brasiliense TaxID=47480 RepID=A0ABT9RHS8_9ACTN|nr:DUF3995 domain-containing protein [Streptosporangium brasiliense]MDP9868841.1 hypothetical protein [Streptosporangium brasiliense]
MKTPRPAAIAAGILLADATVHAIWLTGLTWPASDTRTLSLAVLNAEVPFIPRVLVPLIVLLITAATAVLIRARTRGGRAATLVTAAVATGASLRGLAGLVWAFGLGADPATPFYWLNLLLYTPLCFALATTTAVTLKGRISSRWPA